MAVKKGKTLTEVKTKNPLVNGSFDEKAAKVLGINRNTMRAKIKKLAIDVSRWKR